MKLYHASGGLKLMEEKLEYTWNTYKKKPTPVRFELTRAEHIELAVQHLNLSVTAPFSRRRNASKKFVLYSITLCREIESQQLYIWSVRILLYEKAII